MGRGDRPVGATDAFTSVLAEAVSGLREERVRPLVVGRIAGALLARDRAGAEPEDMELFLLPDEADRALEALRRRGFVPGDPREGWLHRAERDGVTVDLVYRQAGDVYVDEEMLERSVEARFRGLLLPVAAPEDLLVLDVLAHGEDRPHAWWDALALLERPDLDWDYLLVRARQYAVQRVLSLLCYGRSLALPVPDEPLRSLFSFLEERRSE